MVALSCHSSGDSPRDASVQAPAATGGQKGPPMFAKALFRIPVFGWMAREAVEEGGTSMVLFLVNLALLWLLAVLVFGYPAIILPALFLVPVIFVLLILITKG